ncbi:aminoglycoside 6-adenylyltransferase [Paenibacillus polymyxa]|uniref:aminoglycoside 6-adenylyltransferase n=1 Tax=Paenibacillus polymyxa TaxID=1406 RepID=UPI00307ECBA8
MSTEKEMFELIKDVARNDERIRAVYMNGSRTNSNAPKDIYQDYDIVYVVTETASFIKDNNWIYIFGDFIMIQEPDKLDFGIGIDMDFARSYGYLMLLKDGNRIDLHIKTKESMIDDYGTDKLTLPLLDKDNCLPPIPPPTDIDYHIKRPTVGQYVSCTNNFWWCLQNVAKGIKRDEMPYAKRMFEETTRASLDQMVSWWIGTKNDFQVSSGKMGKYFKKYLPHSYWDLYKATYSDGHYENFWNSVFVTCDLFRTVAKDVAVHFLFVYPLDDDINMTEYLIHLRCLPSDATEIFKN